MRKSSITLTAVFVLLTVPVSAQSQTCGNVNGRNDIDISDMVQLLDHLGFGPPLPYPSLADCDGRAGVTISDALSIMNYIFEWPLPPPTFDCSASKVYSMNYTVGDTLRMPYMLGIPDGIDSVSLPITLDLQPGVQGYYIPLKNLGAGSNAVFRLSSVGAVHGPMPMIPYHQTMGDTTVLLPSDLVDTFFTGSHTLFTLNYTRVSTGTGNIVPELVERSSLWVPSFERDGDLFRPAVVPTQVFLPPETLKVSPASLGYASMAGKVAPDSFLVSFSSTGVPISFAIAGSDPWITLKDVPPAGFTTPASVWVKTDATALGIGDYTGSVNITPTDPGTPKTPDAVTVTFHVIPPVTYPPGDFNCDGITDLNDLSRLVSYMTGGGATLKHCNQF